VSGWGVGGGGGEMVEAQRALLDELMGTGACPFFPSGFFGPLL
jgi:hypothetical protein